MKYKCMRNCFRRMNKPSWETFINILTVISLATLIPMFALNNQFILLPWLIYMAVINFFHLCELIIELSFGPIFALKTKFKVWIELLCAGLSTYATIKGLVVLA